MLDLYGSEQGSVLDLYGSEQGPVLDFCERVCETTDSVRGEMSCDHQSDC